MLVMDSAPNLPGSFEHGEIGDTAEAMGFRCWNEVLGAADFSLRQTAAGVYRQVRVLRSVRVFPPRKTTIDPCKSGA